MSKLIHNRGILKESIRAICCAARPRNFGPQNGPKWSVASQTPSVVNLYVTNINHFITKLQNHTSRIEALTRIMADEAVFRQMP